MKRSLELLVLASICLSLGLGVAPAWSYPGEGHSSGMSGPSVESMEVPSAHEPAPWILAAKDEKAKKEKKPKKEKTDKASKEKSNAGREKLSKEEREALREEEGPGAMGRLRRFFGWERSQERMSEQGREHQRATEQRRGPGDREED